MKRTLTCTVALAAGFLLSSAPAPARCENQPVEHSIRSGDNLHLIAGYYYGDPRQWQKIWKTNRKTLGSYDDFRSRVRGK